MKTTRQKIDSNNFNNTTVNYDAFDVTNVNGYSYVVVISGTSLAGSVKLQASNDGTNWVDVPSSSQALPASGGVLLFNQTDVYYSLVRLVGISSDTDVVTLSAIAIGKEH